MHSLSPQQALTIRLHKLGFLLDKAADTCLQSHVQFGLSQFRILAMLRQDSNCSQIHIAELLDQTEAAISRQINLMVKEGLVMRVTKPTNRRERVLSLTDEGRQRLEVGWQALQELQYETFENVNETEKQALSDLAEKLGWRLHRYLEVHGHPIQHHKVTERKD